MAADQLERAIAAFERIHGLAVTVHDLDGEFAARLRPDRQWHRQRQCRTVKSLGHGAACYAFDAGVVREALLAQPDGRIHRCHAGFVEWAMPLLRDGRLSAVLFAGLRRTGPGLVVVEPPARTPIRWPASAPQPAPVGGEQAWTILEHLRQLRARLLELLARLAASGALGDRRLLAGASPHGTTVAADAAAEARRALIADAIANLPTQPTTVHQLARRLGLSPSRCSRVVRQAFGAGFNRLAAERRLTVAADLLRGTRLPIGEIGGRAGYRDRSRFHRAFRARFGTTPAAYRRDGAW